MTLLALLPLLATAAAPAGSADGLSLVLVVANNRSARLDRPPLQYADDDGAKYHEIFTSLAGVEENVLLTEFDRDTARLFPALAAIASSPTRRHLDEASERLAQRAAAARRAGRSVRFYFVFAGHGDVDHGVGVLELADGPFTSSDLEALVRRIGAAESHVILDSCNSFFVITPRKPGGRRFATPRDAAEALTRALPNVGVFLSTSAEAEVFEWSELQSGVFSHAVRSGLLGGADANGDGRITYHELEAFVATATADVKNSHFRPKVFARGPNGEDHRTLFEMSPARSMRLEIDEPRAVRLEVRDRDGLRWLDVHDEPGHALELRLPRGLAGPLEVQRLKANGPDAGTVEATYVMPEDAAEPVALAALAAGVRAPERRGSGEIYRALFARPFGPGALATFDEERANAPEPVFGVSGEERDRLRLLLHQLAGAERQNRLTMGYGRAMMGTVLAGVSAFTLQQARFDGRNGLAAVGFGVAALSLGFGLHDFLSRSAAEHEYEHFAREMAAPGADPARIAADTETRLLDLIGDERSLRRRSTAGGWLLAATGVTLIVLNETVPSVFKENKQVGRLFATTYTSLGLGHALAMTLSGDPAENALRLWQSDANLRHIPQLSIVPSPGGGMVVVSGGF